MIFQLISALLSAFCRIQADPRFHIPHHRNIDYPLWGCAFLAHLLTDNCMKKISDPVFFFASRRPGKAIELGDTQIIIFSQQ
jgi:hypothetical protein